MKKLLSLVLALVMGLGCLVGLTACGDSEADKATVAKVIQALELKYGSSSDVVHDTDYKVDGQVAADGKNRKVDWSVSSDSFSDLANYVEVSKKTDDNNQYTVSVKKADAQINYKLTASVKVGKQKDSISFDRTVNAKAIEGNGTKESPYSVAQVHAIASQMTPKTKLEASDNPQRVYVTGYIVDCGSDSSGNNRVGYVYIVDTYAEGMNKSSDGALMILSITYGTILTGYSDLKVGAKITVSGFIMNYQKNASSDPQHEITYYDKENVLCEYLEKENETPDQIVTNAKNAVNGLVTKTTYTATGEYPLPQENSNGATYTWSVDANEYVEITTGNNLNVKKIPDSGEEPITLKVAVNYTGATTQNTTVPIKVEKPASTSHAGTAADPYTTTEALNLIDQLDNNGYYGEDGTSAKAQLVHVKGYVVELGKWSEGTSGGKPYANFTDTYIAASATSTKDSADALCVYRLTPDSNTPLKTKDDLMVGAEITIVGYLQKYKKDDSTPVLPELTYIGDTNPKATSYTVSDEVKAQAALDRITMSSSFGAAITEYTIPTSTIDGVTLTATNSDHPNVIAIVESGAKLQITHPTDDAVTVTVTISASIGGQVKATKNFPINVAKVSTGPKTEYSVDLKIKEKWSTFNGKKKTDDPDKDYWYTDYSEREISFEEAGETVIEGKITGKMTKQSQTITDMPVTASKNTDEYLVITLEEGATIKSVTFTLKQWNTKTLKNIHIEYTLDGSTWTKCSDDITTPGTLSSTTIPAGAISVRLVYNGGNSSNVQFGLEAISLTVEK